MSGSERSLEEEFAFAIAKLAAEKATCESQMVTPGDIEGAIRGSSSVIKLIRDLTDIANKTGNAELIRAIASLNLEVAEGNLKLADVTNQLAELKQENSSLKQENSRLEDELLKLQEESSTDLDYRCGLYYDKDKPEPFCPNCYASKKKTMLSMSGIGSIKSCLCPSCGWRQNNLGY